jgi:hypothetical protein
MTGVSNLWTWVSTLEFGLYDIFHTSALVVRAILRDQVALTMTSFLVPR